MQRGKPPTLSAQNTHSELLKAKHGEPKKALPSSLLENVLSIRTLYKMMHCYMLSWEPALLSPLLAHLVLTPKAGTRGPQPMEG